jgi:hypothetical protein
VEDAAVGAAAHDRQIGQVGVVAPELVHHLGRDLVFPLARRAGAHGAYVGLGRDAGGGAHRLDLGAALEQAHVVEHVIERHDLERRVAPVARLGAQAVHPAHDSLVEFRMRAHRIENLRAVFHESGEDFVDVRDREGVIGSEVAHGALGSGPPAIPGLARRVAIAHEEDVLALRAARNEHGDRFGFVESRQIEEVAVGAVRIFDVVVAQPDGRGRDDRERVATHELHQRAATFPEFLTSDDGGVAFARR